MFETDNDARLVAANDAFRALALAGAPLVVGSAPWVNAQPAERTAAERAWQLTKQTGAGFNFEFRLWQPNGDITWVLVSLQAQKNSSGVVASYIGTAHDVTQSVTRRVLSEQLIGLLDASHDAVLVFDRTGSLMFANDYAQQLVGKHETPGLGDAAVQTFIQAIRDQIPRELISSTTSNRWQGEVGFRGADSIMRTLDVVLQIVRDANGTIEHYSAIARDITESKQTQDELQRQATHDALTNLPNRVLFLRKLSEALDRSRTLKRGVTVLFVDLDKLKDVNDTIGHGVGDQLIVNMSKRLVSATRPSDVVARIGGDEFVILCDGLGDEQIAMDVANRMRAAVTGQQILQGFEIETSASIGIAMANATLLAEMSSADAAVTLLHHADSAMYRAKQRGRGRCEMYSEEMSANAREKSALSSQLERALATEQLFLVYQPIVSTHTGRIAGAEALLRWQHPDRGVLTPPIFLSLAEESGLIGPIGDWVTRTACADMRTWLDSGSIDASFVMHINVSARQLGDATFVERTMAALRDAKLEPHQIDLEVTEPTLLDDKGGVVRTLNALKRHGLKMAIDDFGTGFSSLVNLRNFAADYLKLDGTFIRDIGSQGGDDPIVRSVIQLAHSLNMSVVAEWVTTQDQAQRLRLLGCDFVQGNMIGNPVVATEFGAKLVQARAN
ncbi:MAG: EAL domain-containing protein [Ilumatobacteraceae bacterium]|nr:EAL domain-containing protein [Ilumatobacteraceae bacterium]